MSCPALQMQWQHQALTQIAHVCLLRGEEVMMSMETPKPHSPTSHPAITSQDSDGTVLTLNTERGLDRPGKW